MIKMTNRLITITQMYIKLARILLTNNLKNLGKFLRRKNTKHLPLMIATLKRLLLLINFNWQTKQAFIPIKVIFVKLF